MQRSDSTAHPRVASPASRRELLASTEARLGRVAEGMYRVLGERAQVVLGDHTCVYATGSGGRGELTARSDLDAFLVRSGRDASNLDAIEITAALLAAQRAEGFPEPSKDGAFLRMHTAERFVALLGEPEDDTENTFTARMLLLLESRPLVGRTAYEATTRRVLDAYWKNFELHPGDYLPIVLVNDIVRYWRILLLNYESRLARLEASRGGERHAIRWLASYKLRIGRCLTCYASLAFLLAESAAHPSGSIARDVVERMVGLSPRDRLEHVIGMTIADRQAHEAASSLASLHDRYLDVLDAPKDALLARFGDEDYRRERAREGRRFGDEVFRLVSVLGARTRLYRYLVV